MMTLDEFELLLARSGSAAHDWPLEQRAAAEGLLKSSLPARKLLNEARLIDRLMQELEPAKAPAHLKSDILARINARIVQEATPQQNRLGFWRSFWPQMVGFAAASMLGVMVGAQSMSPLPDDMADASDYVLGFDGTALTLSMIEDQ